MLLIRVGVTLVDPPGYLEEASEIIPCVFSLNPEAVFSQN